MHVLFITLFYDVSLKFSKWIHFYQKEKECIRYQDKRVRNFGYFLKQIKEAMSMGVYNISSLI